MRKCVLLTLAFVVVSCAPASKEGAAPTLQSDLTPVEVVEGFYRAYDKRDTAAVKQYVPDEWAKGLAITWARDTTRSLTTRVLEPRVEIDTPSGQAKVYFLMKLEGTGVPYFDTARALTASLYHATGRWILRDIGMDAVTP